MSILSSAFGNIGNQQVKKKYNWLNIVDPGGGLGVTMETISGGKVFKGEEAPTPEMPPEAPNTGDASAAAQEELRKKRAKLSRTILSSPQGDLTDARSTKKTLLGG